MNTFAEYILEEEELDAKMEIVYYLSRKAKVFFDKSIVFKAEIARLFLNYSKIDVDKASDTEGRQNISESLSNEITCA